MSAEDDAQARQQRAERFEQDIKDLESGKLPADASIREKIERRMAELKQEQEKRNSGSR